MKYYKRTAASLFFALLVWTPAVWPWGPLGHRITAKMAEDRLKPAAAAAVHNLLGQNARLADVAAWADEQREARGNDQWHYVNVPITETRYDPKYCPAKGCVVSKVKDFERILLDVKAGKAEKQQALKYLVHLIADLHNPLHVGDNNDKGGNLLQVLFYNVGANLHRVWDSQIMEEHTDNEQVWLWELTSLANAREAVDWIKGTPEDWATESLEAAKAAYCLPGTKTVMKSGSKLSYKYVSLNLPIVQRRLAKAGIRTAFILNNIFNKK